MALFIIEMGRNELLTGGSYGPEGGLFVTVVLVLGLLYTFYIVKTPDYPVWTIDSDLPLIN